MFAVSYCAWASRPAALVIVEHALTCPVESPCDDLTKPMMTINASGSLSHLSGMTEGGRHFAVFGLKELFAKSEVLFGDFEYSSTSNARPG